MVKTVIRIDWISLVSIILFTSCAVSHEKIEVAPAFSVVNDIFYKDVNQSDTYSKERCYLNLYLPVDYSCPFELVDEYFKEPDAPYKEIVWFNESGHWPNLEEPEKYQTMIIERVLKNIRL